MNKAKILAIAPYSGLKEMLLEIAKNRDDVEIQVFVADMVEGVEVVKALPLDDYSVILSRAGTAKLIQQVTSIPVIDIGISVYDMLRAIRLSQSYEGKFAVVGFPMITQYAVLINDLMQYNLNIFAVNDANEITPCLNDLKNAGFSLIVGDTITVNNARRVGLNTILVTSGEESVKAALDQSVQWHISNKNLRKWNRLYLNVLHKLNQEFCVFDKQKKLQYAEDSAKPDSLRLQDELPNYMDAVFENGSIKLIKKVSDSLFHIRGEVLDNEENSSVVFFYDTIMDTLKDKNKLVTYNNLDNAPTINLESFTANSLTMEKALEDAEKFSETSMPVIICGSHGCGKTSFAHAIYRKSAFHCNPLIIINCKFASGKQWTLLLESANSPLAYSNYTIYFQNIHLLGEDQQIALESYLRSTDLHKRNRLLFSYVPGYSASFDNGSLLRYVCHELKSLSLFVPALDERVEDIPNLVTLYLNEMNSHMGKQVVGLHAGALKALKDFHWNNNLDQLKRVIQKLMVLTDSAYISEQLTLEALKEETFSVSETGSNAPMDLSGSLDEIIKNVIKLVLKQENMNQSKAAKRLNISRSTLWKKLQ